MFILLDLDVLHVFTFASFYRSEQISMVEPPSANQSLFDQIPDTMTLQPVDVPTDPTNIVPTINPMLDEGPPSVAPFSVPPPSVPPAMVSICQSQTAVPGALKITNKGP